MKLIVKKIAALSIIICLIIGSVNQLHAQTPADDPGGEITGNNTSDSSTPVVPISSNLNILIISTGMLLGYRKLKVGLYLIQ